MFKPQTTSFAMLETMHKIKPNDKIKLIFDSVDFSFIEPLVADKYSRYGRKPFNPVCMFKALLLIYLGEAKSVRDLAEKLTYNTRLMFLCGFEYDDTPANNTFSDFQKRLGSKLFFEILHRIISQAIAAGIVCGKITALDSTHIIAFSNPFGKKVENKRIYSDVDARWGVKDKEFKFFGYKLHLLVDTKTDIPIGIEITPGNADDGKRLPRIVEQAKIKHPEIEIEKLIADKGYPYNENFVYLNKEGIEAYIPHRDKRKNPIVSGKVIIDKQNRFYCAMGKQELVYYGYNKKRNRIKLRCPVGLGKGECLFFSQCSKSSYGRSFYISVNERLQVIGIKEKYDKEFKKIYKERSSVERCNSELKRWHKLNKVFVRGIEKVKQHVILSITAMVMKKMWNLKAELGYA